MKTLIVTPQFRLIQSSHPRDAGLSPDRPSLQLPS